jgi:hypothetical protein
MDSNDEPREQLVLAPALPAQRQRLHLVFSYRHIRAVRREDRAGRLGLPRIGPCERSWCVQPMRYRSKIEPDAPTT